MSLARYALRRALGAALLVYAVAIGAFVITRLAPGDFTEIVTPDLSAAERAARRHALGLDRPLAAQVAEIAVGALRADFGPSLGYPGRSVREVVAERAANTFLLGLAALLIATAIGLPLGRYTGTAGGAGARLAEAASLLVLSLPPLVAALLLATLAARTRLLPTGGMTSAQATSGVQWVLDVARHLVLPALALALPLAATLERLQAASMAESARLPFVQASRARGLDVRAALRQHAWPVSLVPVLGVFGIVIGSVLSGAFVVEVVTQWPGLGRLMVDAMTQRDAGMVAGGAAAAAAGLAVGTVIADVVLAAVDPRVRLAEPPA